MKVNLGLHLSQRAGLSPDLENYVEPSTNTRLNYAEMNTFSNRCAGVIAGCGLQPGDRVALLMQNCVEFVALFYGAAKLGIVVVPPLPLPSARIRGHRAAVPPLEPARGPPPPVERPGPVGPAAARPPSEQVADWHRRRALLTGGRTVRRMVHVPRSDAPGLAPARPADQF